MKVAVHRQTDPTGVDSNRSGYLAFQDSGPPSSSTTLQKGPEEEGPKSLTSRKRALLFEGHAPDTYALVIRDIHGL